jgi:hypothetical protein
MAATAPFLAAAFILVVAGVAKVARPEYTARALQQAGWPASRRWVRAGATLEVAVGILAVAWPGPLSAALVAAAYAGFAGFIVVALRRGWAISSCGCFARPDSRPAPAHAAMNGAAVVAAVWWAVQGPTSAPHIFSHEPWHGGPLILITALIAGLAYLVWNNPLEAAQ